MSKFQRTARALAEYDRTRVERERGWLAALSTSDAIACERAELHAVRKVQAAFFADTLPVNSWDRAKLVDPDGPWLRNLVRKHTPQEGTWSVSSS